MASKLMTHSDGVAGIGYTTAGTFVDVGTVTLPTPGPWNLWGVWFSEVDSLPATTVEIESFLRLNPLTGDIVPFPKPFDFPVHHVPDIVGDGQPGWSRPWEQLPVNFKAEGKARLQFQSDGLSTVTTAPVIAAGFFFGVKPTMWDPMTLRPRANFYDRVTGTADGTTQTTLGTITLSEQAKLITGLCVTVDHATNVEGEEVQGLAEIQSDDIDGLAPFVFPFASSQSAALDPGEAIMMAQPYTPKWMPVHIPVPGGARIEFLTDLVADVGNAADAIGMVCYI